MMIRKLGKPILKGTDCPGFVCLYFIPLNFYTFLTCKKKTIYASASGKGEKRKWSRKYKKPATSISPVTG